MRVLILHNRYRWPGGEDLVARGEAELLRSSGVAVHGLEFDNECAGGAWGSGVLKLALGSNWSPDSYHEVRKVCEQFRPDVAHVHNFWLKASPSVHKACQDAGVPTVQTLHNFRLLCVNATLLRNGKVCEDCVGRIPWRGVVRRCYRDSFAASAATARMIVTNRARQTWTKYVDAFIALTSSSRSKFVAGGLPEDRIFVKPNFQRDPVRISKPPSSSNLVLFVGRLSKEKGVDCLIGAWQRSGLSSIAKLAIVGAGPDRKKLESQAASLRLPCSRVSFVGHQPAGVVLDLLSTARALVLPSVWPETFGRTVIEAFAAGRPVIVSDRGALPEIAQHGSTGLTVPSGDQNALAEALKKVVTDDTLADRLGANARVEYLRKYTPETNLRTLLSIYRFAVERRAKALPEMLHSFDAVPCVSPEREAAAHA